MNEDFNIEALEVLNKALEDSNQDGTQILATLFALPDEEFEILRPALQDALQTAYAEPQTQLQMIQLCNQNGINIIDLIDQSDKIAELICESAGAEISDSKKDFLKFLFGSIANAASSSTLNPAHMVEIPIELCRENAKPPTYATNGAAAMDIYSPEEYTIAPGETVLIPIGIKVAIPHGYALLIQPRSGMSRKTKLRIPNTPGLIDEDYHEEIGVLIENVDENLKDADMSPFENDNTMVKLSGSSFTIGKGERFAQMRLVETPKVNWQQVNSIGVYENDHGAGFGSSGQM